YSAGWGIGFITFASGYLYATGIGVHKIFRISLSGEISILAGSGAVGTLDGEGQFAKFNRPNGITTNDAGDRLFISEYASSSVRVITGIADVSSTENLSRELPFNNLIAFPNPADQEAKIMYDLRESGFVNLHMYDVSGVLIETLLSEYQVTGHHEIKWDTGKFLKGSYICRLSVEGEGQDVIIMIEH